MNRAQGNSITCKKAELHGMCDLLATGYWGFFLGYADVPGGPLS